MGIRVFHCDDSEAFTRLVAFWLAEHTDIEHAGQAHTAQGALDAIPAAAPDVILIDCPPALGLLTVNGLVAADWALISSEAQYFALQGVNGALEVVEQAKEFYNDDLEFLGVVMNIADMRTVHSLSLIHI